MSRSQKLNNEDNSKILREPSAKGLESTIQCASVTINSRPEKLSPTTSKLCRHIVSSQSDGSILKSQDQSGFKQKLVSKVKLWNKDGKGAQNNDMASMPKPDNLASIMVDLETLNLANDASDDAMYNSDLIKARDSLENLSGTKHDKVVAADVVNSKSCSYPSSSQDKEIPTETLASDPVLGINNDASSTTARVLTWDPWNKLGRKNRKENKRRKREKTPSNLREFDRNGSPCKKSKDYTAGDEPRTCMAEPVNSENHNLALSEDELENYEYQPYRHHKKSVEFVNEVAVVYYTGDDVITKSTEPLKKELDQQTRNKEMRRGHIPCTMLGKKELGEEDYMAMWFKK